MPQRLTAPGDEEIRQGRATTLPNPLSIYLAFMFLIDNPEGLVDCELKSSCESSACDRVLAV
ncbi:MAG: hypothetical protein SPI54_01480, partial [Oscillospiraceae bacterium]|nr:hypothetical protein [Ruminococcus sp.]MDY6060560.1 hypothetical protein [Oscillospiraceae bacterium]